ncbi:hypothetical protein KVR01_013389 [Diaporthe batatas]|uniref:uncharacterized protein n=1 Tax=Diaporthe batatas TaxID=748121 RepID=UPI001D056FBF|nr:uncharacterized protein KVR01_013389 [Diaporthe batatas]KAG8156784.1 hypothetical protein KVR01_013389 [Diaporthe batatas]
MPKLDVSELNAVIAVLGAFIVIYGFSSVKIKQVWYLGEALPAVLIGIILGPVSAKFLDAERWGSAAEGQQESITLGICRVVIGVQLVIAGFQLPAKYQMLRWVEMAICLLPVMTLMWLFTTVCILVTIPNLSLLAALVIGSCVTCTDPILSQAVAKGPFSDKYVRRDLREIISSEAGANDGFGFPFLLFVSPYQFSHVRTDIFVPGLRFISFAMRTWPMSSSKRGLQFLKQEPPSLALSAELQRRPQKQLTIPPSLFTIGVCGMLGTDDLLACFVAGNALNWNGQFLEETEKRHDEVNSCVDVLLNFGGFMYIGAIMPWEAFNQPDITGITIGRLIGLGILVFIFRRIPAIFMVYKFMPKVVKDWKEALFMGYFGPIGKTHSPPVVHRLADMMDCNKPGEALTVEEDNLTRAMIPVVYWLVLFSIIFHGLSIPALDLFYRWKGVQPIVEDNPAEVQVLSSTQALPNNSYRDPSKRNSVMMMNRFSRGSTIQYNLDDSVKDRTNSWDYMNKKDIEEVEIVNDVHAVSDRYRSNGPMPGNNIELEDRNGLAENGQKPKEWV